MPKEIEPSSYECDCGHVAHFCENTVNEVKARSIGKKQWLSEGAGLEKHIVVQGAGACRGAAPVDVKTHSESGIRVASSFLTS